MTPQERSQAEANSLDCVLPSWYVAVDPETLDISCPHCCILGQLGGSFNRGQELLGIEDLHSKEYGFLAEKDLFSLERTGEYRILTAEWLERIAERRRETTAPTIAKTTLDRSRTQRLARVMTEVAIGLLWTLFVW